MQAQPAGVAWGLVGALELGGIKCSLDGKDVAGGVGCRRVEVGVDDGLVGDQEDPFIEAVFVLLFLAERGELSASVSMQYKTC